jgi:hypothetical protein
MESNTVFRSEFGFTTMPDPGGDGLVVARMALAATSLPRAAS